MAAGDEGGSGAARRRRERRLRAWHRHVRTTVAMELATALHHSAQRPRPVVEEPREQAGHETYCGLRALMPLPPGTRPAPLSEVAGPQRSDRTARHFAVEPRFPGGVVLVQEPEAHDNTTTRYLLKMALQRKQEEEAEEEEEEVLLAVPPLLRTPTQWARLRELIGASSQSRRRKRKKRRKKKLPRSSSWPRFWRLLSLVSAHSPRAGGARAVRIWKPGFSSHPQYLAPTCLVRVAPEEHRILHYSGRLLPNLLPHSASMLGSSVITSLCASRRTKGIGMVSCPELRLRTPCLAHGSLQGSR